jgi:hypothetical protein
MSQSIKDRIFRQFTSRLDPVVAGVVDVDNSASTCGRGLFIREPASNGQIIFEEFPIWPTVIGFFRFQNEYCYNCMRKLSGDKINCLGRDCEAKYCSTECLGMSSDLFHHALCVASNQSFKRYNKVARDSDNEYYLVAARLLWMFPSAPWKYHFHSPLWSDKDTDNDHMTLSDEIDMMSSLLRLAFQEASGKHTELITSEALGRTIGLLRVNALGLRHDERDLGFAIYPSQSLMNHSDDPNCRCVTVFGVDNPDSPCLCGIEALRDLKAGEELSIDYIGNISKQDRESTLLLQYGIDSSQESVHD